MTFISVFIVMSVAFRLYILFLISYIAINVGSMTILNYNQQSVKANLGELSKRSGFLAVLNCISLWLSVGRNNFFIPLLRISFHDFNFVHRWIGWLIILEAAIHTIASTIDKTSASGGADLGQSLTGFYFLQSGLVLLVAVLVIVIQTMFPIRWLFYEFFLHLHRLTACVMLLGIYFHCKLGQLQEMLWVFVVIVIWFYDWLLRVSRLVYLNYVWEGGITRVVVKALPDEVCRVDLHTPRAWKPAAGMYAYLYVPAIFLWMLHPFSVAWTDSSSAMTASLDESHLRHLVSRFIMLFLIAARSGFTRDFYD